MATRKRLFRGNKLTADRINEVHAGVSSDITSGITADHQPGISKFTMDWNLPSIESYMFDGLVGDPDSYSKILIPWMCLPPQDLDSPLGLVDGNTPFATLRRLSVSFDQEQTNRAFTDIWNAGGGCLDYPVEAYHFKLELREKIPAQIGEDSLFAGAAGNVPNRVVWSQDIPGNLFFGDRAVFNPLVIEDMRVTIHPYRTYVWYIRFMDLVSFPYPTAPLGILQLGVSSFNLRAELEYPLLSRDTATSISVQNIPSIHDGDRQPASISLDTANPAATITAETAAAVNGRVQLNADIIDNRLIEGLNSGYDFKGRLPVQEELVDDSGYVCIAVPMFGQFGDIRASDINTIGLPYGPQGDFDIENWIGKLADRRVIRIQHPMTIHYVIASASYYSPPTTTLKRGPVAGLGKIPSSPTNLNKIGVGIVSGLIAENRKYQQVAYVEYSPADSLNFAIDRIKEGGVPPNYGLGTDGAYDHELLNVPLVYSALSTVGPYGLNSGPPIYVGQSDLDTRSREFIGVLPFDFGGGALGISETAGVEQFIEVRWTIEDSASLSTSNVAVDPQTTYVGNGGNWVYIIGKKSLV
jgi:hypothetical protein